MQMVAVSSSISSMEDGVPKICNACNNETQSLVKGDCVSCYKKACYKANKEIHKFKNKAYYEANKAQYLEDKKSYYSENAEYIASRKKKHYEANREKIVAHNLAYIIKRSKHDPMFRLSRNIRARLNSALRGRTKSGSAVKDLGCSIDELKTHLESLFQPSMTWDNYGPKGWHVDHVKPLASFDLSDSEQLKSACHYTNLQPLWAEENLHKGAKDVDAFQGNRA